MFERERERKIKFIAAVCPRCGSELEVDLDKEVAYCPSCKLMCVVDDNQQKDTKLKLVDKFIGFIERQQNIKYEQKRMDAVRKEKKQAEEREHAKKVLMGLGIFSLLVFIFLMTLVVLDILNII